MIRCFVCVEVINQHNINEIRSILNYISEIKGIRPVKLNQLHLTLKFLGDVPEEQIPQIMAELTKISHPQIPLEFSHLGFFPNDRRPRVMWIGLSQGEQQLKELARKINQQLSTIGFPKEKRAFSPHLTLGRTKSYGKKGINPEEQTTLVQYSKEYGVFDGNTENSTSFFLKKSTLTPQGALYENLYEFILTE